VFCASAQVGLGRADLLQLVGRLSEESSLGADGAMSDVAVVLTMAALYAFDVRILDQDDANGSLNKFCIFYCCHVLLKKYASTVRSVNTLLGDCLGMKLASQVDSAFYPSWDGEMSISFRAE